MQVSREHIGKRIVLRQVSLDKSECYYHVAYLVSFDSETITIKNDHGCLRTITHSAYELVSVDPSIKYYYAITLHDYDYVGDHSYYLTADDAFANLAVVEKTATRSAGGTFFVTAYKLEFFS